MADEETFKAKYPDIFPEKGFCGLSCGKGWDTMVDQALAAIECDGGKLMQVKEKMGVLVIYAQDVSQATQDLLKLFWERSSKVCEGCGTQKDVTREGSWIKSLCPTCRAKPHWWEN